MRHFTYCRFAHGRSASSRLAYGGARSAPGFTLVEILVALAVIATGTFLIMASFRQTTAVAKMNRSERVAMNIAEARLLDVERNPGLYAWAQAALAKAGPSPQPVNVRLKTDTDPKAPHLCVAPETLPADGRTADHEKTFYEGFAWETFAKLPQADAAYVEVTVVVRWTENGKPRLVSLTSSLPRSVVEGTA